MLWDLAFCRQEKVAFHYIKVLQFANLLLHSNTQYIPTMCIVGERKRKKIFTAHFINAHTLCGFVKCDTPDLELRPFFLWGTFGALVGTGASRGYPRRAPPWPLTTPLSLLHGCSPRIRTHTVRDTQELSDG